MVIRGPTRDKKKIETDIFVDRSVCFYYVSLFDEIQIYNCTLYIITTNTDITNIVHQSEFIRRIFFILESLEQPKNSKTADYHKLNFNQRAASLITTKLI